MSWNINFFMKLEHDDLLSGFINLVEEMEQKSDLFRLKSIRGYKGSLISKFKIFDSDYKHEKKISIAKESLKKMLTDKLILKADFDLVRNSTSRNLMENDANGNADELMNASLFLRFRNANWNPVRGSEDLNLIWQIGSYKYYQDHISRPLTTENKRIAIKEIQKIIELGEITEVWGSGESLDVDRNDVFLLYKKTSNIENANFNENSYLITKKIKNGLLVFDEGFFRIKMKNGKNDGVRS